MSALTNESVRVSITGRLAGALTAIHTAFRKHQERRAGARALSGMDDYLLQDLGISRCEIHAVVYGLPGSRRRNHDARR